MAKAVAKNTDYDKLTGKAEVDKSRLTQYADLKREVITLESRLKYLRRIESKNSELEDYLWVTKGGEVFSVYDLQDSHLLNIVRAMNRHGLRIPDKIEDE